jgi:hypothetical protein
MAVTICDCCSLLSHVFLCCLSLLCYGGSDVVTYDAAALLLAAAKKHASKLQHACKPVRWLLQGLHWCLDYGR